MSEHCGQVTHHVKRRGKIRRCDWCGTNIELGERYATWLYFDTGSRSTVYAHAECAEVWQEEAAAEGGIAYADGCYDRPNASITGERNETTDTRRDTE